MNYLSKYEGLMVGGIFILALRLAFFSDADPFADVIDLVGYAMTAYGVIFSFAQYCVYETLRHVKRPFIDAEISRQTIMDILDDKKVIKKLKDIVKKVNVKPVVIQEKVVLSKK